MLLVERALEQARLRTENVLLREEWSRIYGFPHIIGESSAIQRAVAETQRVATTLFSWHDTSLRDLERSFAVV